MKTRGSRPAPLKVFGPETPWRERLAGVRVGSARDGPVLPPGRPCATRRSSVGREGDARPWAATAAAGHPPGLPPTHASPSAPASWRPRSDWGGVRPVPTLPRKADLAGARGGRPMTEGTRVQGQRPRARGRIEGLASALRLRFANTLGAEWALKFGTAERTAGLRRLEVTGGRRRPGRARPQGARGPEPCEGQNPLRAGGASGPRAL